MKIKWMRKSDVSLTKGKTYDVIAIEEGMYRIQDDTGDDYLFAPEGFEEIK
jgi:hypothetical protein